MEISRYEQSFASFLKENVVILLTVGDIEKLTKLLEFPEGKCGHLDLSNGVIEY